MLNKLYEQIKKYIKENYKYLIFFIVCFFLLIIKLPYYISAPGGLINTSEKINNSYKTKGSLNMAYVSEIKGNIPTLLFALINPNWDINKKKEIVTGSESIEDLEFRNNILLKEANNTALLVAYKYSNIDYTVNNRKIYVTYKDDLAQTNLKVKDRITSINNEKVKSKTFLYNKILSHKIGDKVNFNVIRNKKNKQCSAKLINVQNKPKVGIIISELYNIKSNKKIKIKFDKTESGPSGGLMMALSLYSTLNKKDLSKGDIIAGTGTIDEKGKVGEISGVKYKLIGAYKNKAKVFLVPNGNYKEAIKEKKQRHYKIEIKKVRTFSEALEYLESRK